MLLQILVFTAFKIPISENHETDLFQSEPYISFVGRIYESVKQNENDCKFDVNLLEYNNFNFANKEKMNFKMQIVYEAGPDSRFRRLASKLTIGKLVSISGFLDLNENELPYVEAKEIDLIDDFTNNSSQNQSTNNFQSPFSRATKFKKKDVQTPVKKSRTSNTNKEIKIVNDIDDEQMQDASVKSENEVVTASTSKVVNDQLISEKPKKNNKRKKELGDLSVQRLNKAARNTKVKTRSQNQKDDVTTEVEESD